MKMCFKRFSLIYRVPKLKGLFVLNKIIVMDKTIPFILDYTKAECKHFVGQHNMREFTEKSYPIKGRCKYCGGEISCWGGSFKLLEYDTDWFHRLEICVSCLHWRYTYLDWWSDSQTCAHAILKRFRIDSDEIPLERLKYELLNNWHLSKNISAKRAEDLIANIFSEHFECEVEYLTDSVYSPDKGIDFVLISKANNQQIAFQVKRRMTNKSESVIPVRAFLGAVANSYFKHAIYVTTAKTFSRVVRGEFSQKDFLSTRNINLTLVDGTRLLEILKLQVPREKAVGLIEQRILTGIKSENIGYGWHPIEIGGSNYIYPVDGIKLKDVLKTILKFSNKY